MKKAPNLRIVLLVLICLLASSCGSSAPAVPSSTEGTTEGDAPGLLAFATTETIATTGAPPTVAIEVVPGPVKGHNPNAGHNVFIDLEGFTLAPKASGQTPIDGEGHLHLYLDNAEPLHLYNTAVHLPHLPAGEHRVTVVLASNDHRLYRHGSDVVAATQTFTVIEHEAEAHGTHVHLVDYLDADIPVMDPAVVADPDGGWNVSANTTNFNFTPEQVATRFRMGDGHLHLFVDRHLDPDQEAIELYGPNWHLPSLSPGTHTVELEFSHNDHSVYSLDAERIVERLIIEQP